MSDPSGPPFVSDSDTGAGLDQARAHLSEREQIEADDPLGPDCPVRCLGFMHKTYYFTDPAGQLIPFTAQQLGPQNILGLFGGNVGYLMDLAPTDTREDARGGKRRGGDKQEFHSPTVLQKLISGCTRRGFFDPESQVRGRGVWPVNDLRDPSDVFRDRSQLIYHAGRRLELITYGSEGVTVRQVPAGEKIGAFVYPAEQDDDELSAVPAGGDDVAFLQEYIADNWPWRDGADLSAWLIVGWYAIALMPAAVPMRPTVWLQGPSGCGKSTIVHLLRRLLQYQVHKYDNATAATLRNDFLRNRGSWPVMINEANAKEGSQTIENLIEMARGSYQVGEGETGRGGTDGYKLNINSAWLFAMVQPPVVDEQDANRIATLRLNKLHLSRAELEAFGDEAHEIGARLGPLLRRRMLEHWRHLPRAIAAFRGVLLDAGHTPRTSATIGTLLAAAYVLRHGSRAPDIEGDIRPWTDQLRADQLAERSDLKTNDAACLQRMLSASIPAWKAGERLIVAECIDKVLDDQDQAYNRQLARSGIAIVTRKGRKYLAVANNLAGVLDVFKGTPWPNGQHKSALEMLADGDNGVLCGQQGTWASVADRGTFVPVEMLERVKHLEQFSDGSEVA